MPRVRPNEDSTRLMTVDQSTDEPVLIRPRHPPSRFVGAGGRHITTDVCAPRHIPFQQSRPRVLSPSNPRPGPGSGDTATTTADPRPGGNAQGLRPTAASVVASLRRMTLGVRLPFRATRQAGFHEFQPGEQLPDLLGAVHVVRRGTGLVVGVLSSGAPRINVGRLIQSQPLSPEHSSSLTGTR